MQVLKNSGYNSIFRKEILKAGIAGYNKILEQDKEGTKPLYRSKDWRRSARRLAKKDKKINWLGSYKACIFVPPTPNSELKQLMQAKELEMRPGGRENWPIRIVETSGQTLGRALVKTDLFNRNKCLEKTCLP